MSRYDAWADSLVAQGLGPDDWEDSLFSCEYCQDEGGWTCERCEGEGVEECDASCGHIVGTHPCPECRGTGEVECNCATGPHGMEDRE